MKPMTLIPILFGAAAALFAFNRLSGSKPVPKPTYFVARDTISAYQPVKWELVSQVTWNESGPMPKGYISDAGQLFRQMPSGEVIASRFARSSIEKGKPITENELWGAGVTSLMMAKLQNNPDLCGVPVAVTEITGGAGFVRPGDRVDVAASGIKVPGSNNQKRAKIFLQNVEVLLVNQSETPPLEAGRSSASRTIQDVPRHATLLVTSRQAELLLAVAQEATIHLILRAGNTRTKETTGATVADALAEGTAAEATETPAANPTPQLALARPEPTGLAAQPHVVEVLRGEGQANRIDRVVFQRRNGEWVTPETMKAGTAGAEPSMSATDAVAPAGYRE